MGKIDEIPSVADQQRTSHVSDRSHEMRPGNIARQGGKPKGGEVKFHGGMKRQQVDMAGLGGLPNTIGGYPDASASNPLAPEAQGKRLRPAPAVVGQQSRTTGGDLARHSLGHEILAEAFASSAGDDRMAHGRGADGHLPRGVAGSSARPSSGAAEAQELRNIGGRSRR